MSTHLPLDVCAPWPVPMSFSVVNTKSKMLIYELTVLPSPLSHYPACNDTMRINLAWLPGKRGWGVESSDITIIKLIYLSYIIWLKQPTLMHVYSLAHTHTHSLTPKLSSFKSWSEQSSDFNILHLYVTLIRFLIILQMPCVRIPTPKYSTTIKNLYLYFLWWTRGCQSYRH